MLFRSDLLKLDRKPLAIISFSYMIQYVYEHDESLVTNLNIPKEIEKNKFQALKNSVESKLRNHINTNTNPKFGNETEGHVFHPSLQGLPRFKLTSDSFVKFKENQKSKGK